MDEADYAAEAQHVFVEAAIAAVVARSLDGVNPGGSIAHCVACGEPIPASRRRALPGCRHCIDCAHAREAESRLYPRAQTRGLHAADC